MSGWARKHSFSSPAPQPAPNPKCSTANQPTSHLGTEALLNIKEKKTRYLVPTGMSRTQEAFIENTAFKTWHL